MAAIDFSTTADAGHTVKHRILITGQAIVTAWADRPLEASTADYATLTTWVMVNCAGANLLAAQVLDEPAGADIERIATAVVTAGIAGTRTINITWSSPFPSPAYNIDVGAATGLVGIGTTTVASSPAPTAAGCTILCQVTTLLAVGLTFPVLAWT